MPRHCGARTHSVKRGKHYIILLHIGLALVDSLLLAYRCKYFLFVIIRLYTVFRNSKYADAYYKARRLLFL